MLAATRSAVPRWVPLVEFAWAVLRRLKARRMELTVAPAMLAGGAPSRVVTVYCVELLRPEM